MAETNKCQLYEEQYYAAYDALARHPDEDLLYRKHCFCLGTKEREECSCDGNESQCNFYPKKRGLKPCPFCGGPAEVCLSADAYGQECHCVSCKDCKNRTAYHPNREEAIFYWNRRV